MFSQLQMIFGGIVVASVVAVYYFFHLQPMNEKDDTINTLRLNAGVQEKMIIEVGNEMNVAYAKLYSCEDNLTVQYNQGYVDALGGIDETDTSVDLDNLHT